MRKAVVLLCCAVFLISIAPIASEAKVDREPGGPAAFLVGCCWGIREGTQWNDGSDMHWREWVRIVPIVGFVVAIWDGIECYNGITSHEWARQNGANWY